MSLNSVKPNGLFNVEIFDYDILFRAFKLLFFLSVMIYLHTVVSSIPIKYN